MKTSGARHEQGGFQQGNISSFLGVLIDLIIELLGLIIKPFDNQTKIWA
jgi:hypothetical protein